MGYWSDLLAKLDSIFSFLPTLNPDKISWLGAMLSPIYLLAHNANAPALALLASILFLDYLDGLMARRLRKRDEHIDLSCDRISELCIFLAHPSLLPLVVLNIALSTVKLAKRLKVPLIIPLRHGLFLYHLLSLCGLL